MKGGKEREKEGNGINGKRGKKVEGGVPYRHFFFSHFKP